LVPDRQRDVFAPLDGTIVELAVDHGRRVRFGDALAVLRNSEVDVELQRVRGAIEEAKEREAAVETLRVETSGDTTSSDRFRLTAEEVELQIQLMGLERQRDLWLARQRRLTVRAPLDGEVITWNAEALLRSRPVRRGQRLMRIADLEGPWTLQLRLPEYRAEHVLSAGRQSDDPLPVSFLLESDPSTIFEGAVREMSLAAEPDTRFGSILPVTVDVRSPDSASWRPGATVIAKIHCGRRSLGYVWLRDLWEFLQAHVWF
jgi:multidrug efflux pump subunit AcrA (membrane-fusion protein)